MGTRALLLALYATGHRPRALLVLGAVPLLAGLVVHGMAERASRTLIPATRAPPAHLAVSPDGRFVALADIRGRVLIRDTQGIVEVHKVEHGANPVRAIGFYREAPMLPLEFATVVEGVEKGFDYAMVERAASPMMPPMTPTANFWREVVVTQWGAIAEPGERVHASVLSNGPIAAVACGQACVFAALARPTPDVPARGLPGQIGVATRTPLRGRPTAFHASDGTTAATRFGFGDGMIGRGLSSPGVQRSTAATVVAVGTRDSLALLSDGSLAWISELRVLRAECPSCSMIVAAPDGDAALVAGGRAARLIRLSELSDVGALTDARARFTNSVIGLAHPIDVTAIAISGQIAATGSADGLVRLWDAGNGRLLGLIRGHRDAIAHIAVTEEGTLVTVSLDGEVRVADVAGVRVATIVDPLAVYEAAARTDWKALMPENARRLLARVGT